jgi:hypothetical protein
MSRQATDNLYIELDYFTPESYYTYEAVAVSALAAESTITCEGNVTASGEIVMASGDFPAFATISCTISHIHGSDLFAFSEAAIAVQIDRIRDTNTAATAVFDIATDGRAFRDITSDDEAVFSINAIIGRSQDAVSAVEVAFSLAADFTTLKVYASDLALEATVFAVISNVKGVDILQQNFASLDIVAEVTANGVAILDTTSSISAIVGIKHNLSATLNAYSSLFVSRNVSTGRPNNFIVTTSPTTVNDILTTEQSKFGSYSIKFHNNGTNTVSQIQSENAINIPMPNESWVYEVYFYFNSSWINSNTILLGSNGSGGVGSFFNISTSTNKVAVRVRKTGYNVETIGTVNLTANSWNHILVVYDNATISSYVNGVRNTFVDLTAFITANWTVTTPKINAFVRENTYIDEISYYQGSNIGYNPLDTSISIPTNARTNTIDTKLLWHFEGNNLDDVSLVQSAQAGLISVSNVSAQLSGPQRTSAVLAATASVVSAVSVDRGADITLDNFATLTADATHIKLLASDFVSEFSQQATADYIFGANADLTVDSQIAIDSQRDRAFTILTDAVGVIVAVTAKVGAFFINAETETIFAVDADKTTDVNSTLTVDSNTSILGEKYGSLEAAVDCESALESSADRIRDIVASLDTTVDINIESSNTLDMLADLATDVDVSTLGNLTRTTSVELDSLFTISADTEDSLTVRIISDMFSQGQVILDNSRLRDNIIATESVAINLVVVVKTTDADIPLTSTLELSALPNKITGYTVELDSEFKVMADASGGTIRATLVAESFANLTAQAESTLSAQGNLNSVFTVSADTEDSLTVRIISDMFSNGQVTADNSRLRDNIVVTESVASNLVVVVKTTDADILLASTLELSAEANKFTGYTAELDTNVSLSALGNLTRTTSVELDSLFTVFADTTISITVRIISDMFSNGQVTADNDRLRDNTIITDAVAINLAAVVKTTDVDIPLTSTLELSALPNKITGYTAEVDSDVSVSVLGNLTRTTSVELDSQTAVSATGRKDSKAAANLSSSITLSALGVKDTDILLQAFTNGSLILDANVIREVAIEESATTELGADILRIRSGQVELLAFAAQLTVGTKQADAIALTLGTFSLSVNTSVLHIQEYVYKIPGEGRQYKISTESRLRTISGETRYYKVY